MTVAATHKECLIRICQHNVKGSSEKGLQTKDRINNNSITWFVQVWPNQDHTGYASIAAGVWSANTKGIKATCAALILT
jgi:hypothetical protein